MSLSLEGQAVVVTGGGSGIGRACAMRAAAAGAAILVVDISARQAQAVADEISAVQGRAIALAADVRDREQVRAAFAHGESNLGPLTGLVAAAGVGGAASAESMDAETWSRVIDTNLTGLFYCAQAAGQSMLRRGRGSIIAIGSGAGLGGIHSRAHYCASKHGVNGLVKALAIEWGPAGVRVNCVAPGPVDTPLLRRHWPQERIDRIYLDRIPLRRLATPEDEAEVVHFLLSDASAYVTGVVLPVNGGLSAGHSTSYAADPDVAGSRSLPERNIP